MYDKDTLEKQKDIPKYTSFRIVQVYLEKTGRKVIALDQNDLSFEFNLLNCVKEYERIATDLLVKLIKHSVVTLVIDRETKKEILINLDNLLPGLINYSDINENERYKLRSEKRSSKKLKN